MRHPALRRPARHSAPKPRPQAAGNDPEPLADPSPQNRIAPNAPPDGDHNQGGVRREGIDYQRDLGSEQDA